MADPAILPTPNLTTAEARAHYARSLDCVHCGLCLPVCPTYKLTGRETSSPRGRIYLMRAVADGRQDPGEVYNDELHFCLACRACETVCPSGVQFEALVEHARADERARSPRQGLTGVVERFLLRRVVPSRTWLKIAAEGLSLYTKTPIGIWLRNSGILDKLIPGLTKRELLMPRIPKRAHRQGLPETIPARGTRRGRVAIQEGCVASQLLQDVNEATARVLTKNGWEVVLWRRPSCCGALHAHAGDLDMSRELARRNIEAFEKSGADWFVHNSAGCGSHVKQYARLLENDAAWRDRAAAVAGRSRDISEFLVETGFEPRRGPMAVKVAYDEPCHLVHGQRVSSQPRQLLQSVPGIQLVPLAGATDCCGAAGLYSIERMDDSLEILDVKMQQIRASGCEIVATGNPGCILQLRSGIHRAGLAIPVVHPIQLLDEG